MDGKWMGNSFEVLVCDISILGVNDLYTVIQLLALYILLERTVFVCYESDDGVLRGHRSSLQVRECTDTPSYRYILRRVFQLKSQGYGYISFVESETQSFRLKL